MPAFRIHTMSGLVLLIPSGQFEELEELHQILAADWPNEAIGDPFSHRHVRAVVAANLAEANRLSLTSIGADARECCLRRDSVVAIEQL